MVENARELTFGDWMLIVEGSFTPEEIPEYFYLCPKFSEDFVRRRNFTPPGAVCTLGLGIRQVRQIVTAAEEGSKLLQPLMRKMSPAARSLLNVVNPAEAPPDLFGVRKRLHAIKPVPHGYVLKCLKRWADSGLLKIQTDYGTYDFDKVDEALAKLTNDGLVVKTARGTYEYKDAEEKTKKTKRPITPGLSREAKRPITPGLSREAATVFDTIWGSKGPISRDDIVEKIMLAGRVIGLEERDEDSHYARELLKYNEELSAAEIAKKAGITEQEADKIIAGLEADGKLKKTPSGKYGIQFTQDELNAPPDKIEEAIVEQLGQGPTDSLRSLASSLHGTVDEKKVRYYMKLLAAKGLVYQSQADLMRNGSSKWQLTPKDKAPLPGSQKLLDHLEQNHIADWPDVVDLYGGNTGVYNPQNAAAASALVDLESKGLVKFDRKHNRWYVMLADDGKTASVFDTKMSEAKQAITDALTQQSPMTHAQIKAAVAGKTNSTYLTHVLQKMVDDGEMILDRDSLSQDRSLYYLSTQNPYEKWEQEIVAFLKTQFGKYAGLTAIEDHLNTKGVPPGMTYKSLTRMLQRGVVVSSGYTGYRLNDPATDAEAEEGVMKWISKFNAKKVYDYDLQEMLHRMFGLSYQKASDLIKKMAAEGKLVRDQYGYYSLPQTPAGGQ